MKTKIPPPKPATKILRGPQIKKILVPVDFSTNARPAFQYARFLARLCDASVFLLHVIPPPAVPPEFGYIPPDQDVVKERLTRHIGALQMEEFEGVPTDFHIAEGYPFDHIVQVARETAADLIVMASHGHTGLKHLLIGSTAEKVTRYASCPVLIVRSPLPAKPRRPKKGSR